MNHNENVVLLGESQKWSNWLQLNQKVWIWMSFCSSRKLLMQIPSKNQTQTKVHFVLNLTAPSYYFKITSSEIPRLAVLSVKRLIARCVIAAWLLVHYQARRELLCTPWVMMRDPQLLCKRTYLNLYFANCTTASRVTMTRSMLVGAKKFLARQSRIRKQRPSRKYFNRKCL